MYAARTAHHLTHLPSTRPIIISQVLQDPSFSGCSHPSTVFCKRSQGMRNRCFAELLRGMIEGRLPQHGREGHKPASHTAAFTHVAAHGAHKLELPTGCDDQSHAHRLHRGRPLQGPIG